jgi:predicted amidohydrolase YtcJ
MMNVPTQFVIRDVSMKMRRFALVLAGIAATLALAPGASFWLVGASLATLSGDASAEGPAYTVPPPRQAPGLASLLYAHTVLLDGKLLTMDRDTTDFSVAEALAIRDGKIVAVGTSADIRTLVGPQTIVLDLQGRTVIPGIIDTHAHLHEYAPDRWLRDIAATEPELADFSPLRLVATSPDDALAQVEQLVRDRGPGRWVQVAITPAEVAAATRQRLTLEVGDRLAPDNPLVIATTGTVRFVNSEVVHRVQAVYGGYLPDDLFTDADGNLTGFAALNLTRIIQGDVLVRDPMRSLSHVYGRELLAWAGIGVTTWSSSIAPLNALMVLSAMDRQGQLPIRLAYSNSQGLTAFPLPGGMYTRMGDLAGHGTDMLWNVGMSPTSTDGAYPTICTNLPAPPEIKTREVCYFDPDRPELYRQAGTRGAVGARHRIAGAHTEGDRSADAFLDTIEQGSAEAGMTLEEIRAKRHALDHCSLNPRPDQILRAVRLGVMFSCNPAYILLRSPLVAADYGLEYVAWIAPMRSLLAAGSLPVYESDSRAIVDQGPFAILQHFITRTDEQGNTWVPEEAIDRRTALLTATRWAARYVLREQMLGSLEPGKWADLVVLDRDYDTAPEVEIGAIQALATMVGGRFVYQAPGFP